MTVLLTGYEPFGEHERNPSETLANRFDGRTVADASVVGRVLPVEYDAASEEMVALIDDHDPEVIVSMGLAGGRSAVSVERIGINVADCVGVPDNAGAEPRNERVAPAGADAHFSTLPVTAIVADLLDADIPARVSNTAGTHLCNDILYSTRRHVETNDLDTLSGFVHLPYTPEQAAAKARDGEAESAGSVPASMPLSLQSEAIERVVETALRGQ